MSSGYYILGNGGAANYAIKALRSAGYTGELHQISDDAGPGFNPMVAPYYLAGKADWQTCFPFGESFLADHQVIVHHDDKVAALDAENAIITTASGEQFHYDKCLVATGARPAMPPVSGLRESRYAFPLREAHTISALEQAHMNASRVLVLGASFVGIELAEVFTRKGISVVLVDIAPQIMPQGAHPLAAQRMENWLHRHGVEVRLKTTLSQIEDTRDGVICHFPESAPESFDFIAVCAGIRPNLEFIDPGQVKIDRALCTNDFMQTSVANIYAAGDVCESFNRLATCQQWMGTWGNACYQGRIAGLNMANVRTRSAGSIPQHVSPVFAWTYMQVGDALRQGEQIRVEEHGDPFNSPYYLAVYDQDVLIGANLINNPGDLEWIKKEITQEVTRINTMRDAV